MEDMRLFRVIIVLSSLLFLTNCASNGVQTVKETHGSLNTDMPELPSMGEKYMSMPGMLWNGVQYLRFNLNDKEKMLHQSAVYHTLNNAEIGAVTSWHSKERLSTGRVRVVHEYPQSSGYCRVYQSYIELNGAKRHMVNKAGKLAWHDWVFLR
jgi:surface antigen